MTPPCWSLAPQPGEKRRIAGTECTFHVTASGAGFLSDPYALGRSVSALPLPSGRWFVLVDGVSVYVDGLEDVAS
jgi:hypothetical protein